MQCLIGKSTYGTENNAIREANTDIVSDTNQQQEVNSRVDTPDQLPHYTAGCIPPPPERGLGHVCPSPVRPLTSQITGNKESSFLQDADMDTSSDFTMK